MSPQSRHSGFLDLLRTAAIALVFLRHGISTDPGADDPDATSFVSTLATTVASNGWLGVDLFFVLSGYLLCSQILDERQRGTWFPHNFYLRRAIRILPPYLTVLLVCWLGGLASVLGSNGVLSPYVLLTHLLFLQDYYGAPLLVTLWSLATEEKFYLAIPLVATVLVRTGRGRAALLLLSFSLVVVLARTLAIHIDAPANYPQFFWKYRAPFHFAIDGLVIGTAVAFAEKHLSLQSRGPRLMTLGCGVMALGGALALLCTTNWLSGPHFERSSIAIWCFSACCGALIFAVRGLRLEDPLPGVPRLVTRIAGLSYSLYLSHYPVAVMAQRLITPGDSRAAFWVLYLSVSLLSALILNSVTEAPFRQLRQRLRQQPVSKGDTGIVQITPAA